MIVAIGWIALALGGGYIIGGLALFFLTAIGRGGLGSLPMALAGAAIAVIVWLSLVAWLSPLSIGWGV